MTRIMYPTTSIFSENRINLRFTEDFIRKVDLLVSSEMPFSLHSIFSLDNILHFIDKKPREESPTWQRFHSPPRGRQALGSAKTLLQK